MEEHDDASLMLGEEEGDHHHPHHHHHHHEEDNDHGMHEEDMDIEPTRIVGVSSSSPGRLERDEFWDHEPTKEEIWEMKKANKRPSEWLKMLCKDWAEAGENLELIETVDSKFESYKPYLKGKLSSQLLCRLCIPSETGSVKDSSNPNGGGGNTKADFLRNVLNVQDEFDKAYVTAQVERFCALYDVRGIQQQADAAIADASNNNNNSSNNTNNAITNTINNNRFAITNNEATAAAAAALYGDLVVNAALGSVSDVHQQAIAAAAAATATATATANQQQAGISIPPHFLSADATAAAVAAAQQAQAQAAQQSVNNENDQHMKVSGLERSASASGNNDSQDAESGANASTSSAGPNSGSQAQQQSGVFTNNRSAQALLTKAQQQAKSAERALEQERRQNAKREQKRLSQDKKLAKQRDREFLQKQKQAEKLARERAREEKRTRKLLQRQRRERFAQEQKEAALRRAAELVASNRVPIEITRAGALRNRGAKRLTPVGTTAGRAPEATEAVNRTGANGTKTEGSEFPDLSSPSVMIPKKRQRSAIVVSTASDLDRIVTHSQNLWAKYNAIAKEHNQRVNWITVAKELGIHVKVREKYARMHSRACQRNFDFVTHGHWKIKDHPEIFQEPTAAEQKARMPPPLPPPMNTATVVETNSVVTRQVTDNMAAAVVVKDDAHGEDLQADGRQGVDNNGLVLTEGELGQQQQQQEIKEVGDSSSPAINDSERRIVSEENNDPMQDPTTAVASTAAGNTTNSINRPLTPQHHQHHHIGISNSVDAAAAAATAAAVVDAAGVGGATIDMHHVVELTATAAATAAASGSETEIHDGERGGNTGDATSTKDEHPFI